MKQKKLTLRFIDYRKGKLDKAKEEITTTFQAKVTWDKNEFIVTIIGIEKEINKDTQESYFRKIRDICISNDMRVNRVELTIDDVDDM